MGMGTVRIVTSRRAECQRARSGAVGVRRLCRDLPPLRPSLADDASQKHRAAFARHAIVMTGHVAANPIPHSTPYLLKTERDRSWARKVPAVGHAVARRKTLRNRKKSAKGLRDQRIGHRPEDYDRYGSGDAITLVVYFEKSTVTGELLAGLDRRADLPLAELRILEDEFAQRRAEQRCPREACRRASVRRATPQPTGRR